MQIYFKVPFSFSNDRIGHKILFMRTDYFEGQTVGGSFSHAQGFISGVKKMDWEIFAVGSGVFFQDKLRFYKIPYPKYRNSPEIPEIIYNYRFFWRSLKIIKTEKPAFIYYRHGLLNIAPFVLRRVSKTPLILEYNGSEAWAREKWGGRLFLHHLAYYFEKINLENSDLISVVSQVLKDELVSKGIESSKIILNPNGVDVDKFCPDADGASVRRKYQFGSKIAIGFLGTFGAWHGVEVLAAAVKGVVKKNSDVIFLMIGDGNLRPLVEKTLTNDEVRGNVILPGLVAHNEVPAYLSACDILVSPHVPNKDGTKFFGSPTKLFEYMAMGKGIVASELEQIGKVLEHKKTAWMVKPGDVDDLAESILKLVNDQGLRTGLGKNAREEVIKKYTWKENARRIIEAYNKIAES